VRLREPERLGLGPWCSVGAEHDVDPRRQVRVVARIAVAGVVGAMERWRAEEKAERAEIERDVRVDEDREERAKGDEPEEAVEWEAEEDGGRVHDGLRVEAIERMLAVRGEPVDVLARVVDGVDAPEEVDPMLEPMARVRGEVTEAEREHDACGEGQRGERAAEAREALDRVERTGRERERRRGEPGEDEVLPEEEREVGDEAAAEDRLVAAGREDALERDEHDGEEREARARGRERRHRSFPAACGARGRSCRRGGAACGSARGGSSSSRPRNGPAFVAGRSKVSSSRAAPIEVVSFMFPTGVASAATGGVGLAVCAASGAASGAPCGSGAISAGATSSFAPQPCAFATARAPIAIASPSVPARATRARPSRVSPFLMLDPPSRLRGA
jgi:hypothetical protein